MPPSSEVPVLIVGAGPTGLTLACDLARRGIQFRLIDKSPIYFPGSRGKGLQPRSLEVLDDLGVADRILACGRFHLPFRAYDGAKVLGDRDVHEGRHPTPETPYASSMIIPQWRVEETLRRLLEQSGNRVELETELTSITQNENEVTATIRTERGEEQLRCRYLVGSDGGRSFTRKSLQFSFEGETWPDARMLIADVRVAGLGRDHWHTWSSHPDGWLALCPLPSTELFQLQIAIPPEYEQEPSLEAIQQIVNQRTSRTDLVLSSPTWMSLYKVNVRMVSQYRKGRVFLAGDSAHVHTPAGGQGMNTGIQDAYNLGWKLGCVLNGADPALLDTYEEERLPVAAGVLGITSRLARAFVAAGNQMQRDPDTLQLGINYRGCKLSKQEGAPARSLEPGDRAPDGRSPDGRRLFDLFRGPHFTLLSTSPIAERSANSVQIHTVPKVYGAGENTLVLIRPDGYIAWIGSSIHAVRNYLRPFALISGPPEN